MFVTARLVVEDGNILPRRAAFVGPNRSFDEASKTLDSRNECENARDRQCCEIPGYRDNYLAKLLEAKPPLALCCQT